MATGFPAITGDIFTAADYNGLVTFDVIADKTIADLGIRTIRFANGVLLNLKKTDFEDNRVRYSLRIDGGRLHFAKDEAVFAWLMSGAYVSGGLAAHDFEDLRSLLSEDPSDKNLLMRTMELEKSIASNLGLLGFTPSDRTRLGLAEVKARSKLEALQDKWASNEQLAS